MWIQTLCTAVSCPVVHDQLVVQICWLFPTVVQHCLYIVVVVDVSFEYFHAIEFHVILYGLYCVPDIGQH